MTDEGGVLGNLPNSRPGRRSAKRDRAAAKPDQAAAKRDQAAKAAGRPADAAATAAASAEASGTAAAKPAPAAKPARAAKPTQAARPPRPTTAVKGQGPGHGVDVMHDMDAQRRHDSAGGAAGDPLSAVVRTATGLAVTGVKVGGAVTKELFRRLPRP